MTQPLTRGRGSEQISHLDDVDLNPKPRLLSPRVLGIFSAIAFTALGAVLYAMGTWPWQAAAPSIAVAALQNQPAPIPSPPPAADTPKFSQEGLKPAAPDTAPIERPAPVERPAPQQSPQAALQPAPPSTEAVAQPTAVALPAPSPEQLTQARALIARAERIIAETQDIAAARLFLERAAKLGEPRATFALAQTYDPAALRERGVRGITGDVGRARTLYESALGQGISAARERLSNLR
jgi:hypothetical protein